MKKSGMPPMKGMKKMNPFGKTPAMGAMKPTPKMPGMPKFAGGGKAKKAKC